MAVHRFDESADLDARRETSALRPSIGRLPPQAAALLGLQQMAGNRAMVQTLLDEGSPQREYPGPRTPVRSTTDPALGPLEGPNIDGKESGAPAYTMIVAWLAARKQR